MNHALTDKPVVLIVDDSIANIEVLGAALARDYEIRFATGGAEGLELATRVVPDLILLDVMMPGMDGYEVCQRLKSDIRTKDIPVIFVTSLGERGHEARGLEVGAVDYLQKPCHAAIVKLRVRIHLEQHNQNLALERRVEERTRELLETRKEVVRCLGRAAEYRDNETGMHVMRMSKAAQMIAMAAGLSPAQAELIFLAAPMHDIGKIGIPDHVLLKPGRFEPEEWEVMKTHAQIGADILGNHDSDLLRLARSVALTHHEKWDGTGYPKGLAGEDIPIEGRIVSIADVYDALTSMRPYKTAWSQSDVVKYMQEQSGISFDPHLLEVFLSLIPDIERMVLSQ